MAHVFKYINAKCRVQFMTGSTGDRQNFAYFEKNFKKRTHDVVSLFVLKEDAKKCTPSMYQL